MGKAKKTRKFAAVKRTLNTKKDQRLTQNNANNNNTNKKKGGGGVVDDPELTRSVPQVSSALFFKYNESIKPPYQVLIDTNFINFSIQKKIDIIRGLMVV